MPATHQTTGDSQRLHPAHYRRKFLSVKHFKSGNWVGDDGDMLTGPETILPAYADPDGQWRPRRVVMPRPPQFSTRRATGSQLLTFDALAARVFKRRASA